MTIKTNFESYSETSTTVQGHRSLGVSDHARARIEMSIDGERQ